MRNSWKIASTDVTVNEGDFLNYIGAYARLDSMSEAPDWDVKDIVGKYKAKFIDSKLALYSKEIFSWKAECRETSSLREFKELTETVLKESSIS